MGDVNLRAALLAAAEEAGKLQEESRVNQARIDNLERRADTQEREICQLRGQVDYLLESDNKMRDRLQQAGNMLRALADYLESPF